MARSFVGKQVWCWASSCPSLADELLQQLANAPIPLPARPLAFHEGLRLSFVPLVDFLSFPGTLMPAALRDVQSEAAGTSSQAEAGEEISLGQADHGIME